MSGKEELSPRVKEILEAILKLPVEERMEILRKLCDSLDKKDE